MRTGMLWFGDKKDTLTVQIQKAIAYYVKQYQRTPDLCMVHPSMLKDGKVEIKGLTVRPYRPVLPGHIWIGVADKE